MHGCRRLGSAFAFSFSLAATLLASGAVTLAADSDEARLLPIADETATANELSIVSTSSTNSSHVMDGSCGACGSFFDSCTSCCRPWTFRGWLDAGYVGNTSNPTSKFNGPYNAVDRANEPMFNQGYLIAERALPTDGTWGTGGRVDMLYGEDFFLAQSAGLEVHPNGSPHWNPEFYGLAIPQAYGQFGNDVVSVKAGHFYSPVGYEGVTAASNFFYSHAYSYQFAGPFTHWGGLATAKLNDCWSGQIGLVNGWNALDRTSDQIAEIAALKYTQCNWWTQFAIISGDEYDNDAGLPGIASGYANRTRYSWIVDYQPAGSRWEYVFHQWLGAQNNGTPTGAAAYWYGLDQYFYYRFSDCWRAGLRTEWFRDEDGTRVGLNRASNPNKPPFAGNFYSVTAGLNWTPNSQFTLRPEFRYDWFDGAAGVRPYDDGGKINQLMFGFDAIYQF